MVDDDGWIEIEYSGAIETARAATAGELRLNDMLDDLTAELPKKSAAYKQMIELQRVGGGERELLDRDRASRRDKFAVL